MASPYLFKNGYLLKYHPNHPRTFNGALKNYVYEHILVVEKELKRNLLKDDVVHHLNGCRSDNSIKNLLVLSKSMHNRLHAWLKTVEHNQDSIEYETINICDVDIKIAKIKRCGICKFPTESLTCSQECYKKHEQIYGITPTNLSSHIKKLKRIEDSSLNKESMLELLDGGFSWVELGKMYGYSDAGIRLVATNVFGIQTKQYDGRKTKRFSEKMKNIVLSNFSRASVTQPG